MKKLLSISIFLILCTLGYSQETNKELLKKAEMELSTALEKEDYEKAAQLKKEIETRKEIEKAVENGDYELAARLKNNLEAPIQNRTENKPASNFNMSTAKPSKGFYPPEEGNAAVYISRVDKTGLAVGFEYFHEDQYIGEFQGKGYLRFECEAGDHLFWASSENKESITTELEPGRIYIIQATQAPGGWKIHAELNPISASDSKIVEGIKKIVQKEEASHVSEAELLSINKKMTKIIEEELDHYQNVTKDRYNFHHLSPENFIPMEMLK